jgi:DNA-binding Lrp family transcriptional regulator
MKPPADNTLLFKLAHQIQMATQFVDEGQASPEALMTSADLARVFGIEHEQIKKRLRQLKEMGIICIVGANPKRYRFDNYSYKQLLRQEGHDETIQAILEYL